MRYEAVVDLIQPTGTRTLVTIKFNRAVIIDPATGRVIA